MIEMCLYHWVHFTYAKQVLFIHLHGSVHGIRFSRDVRLAIASFGNIILCKTLSFVSRKNFNVTVYNIIGGKTIKTTSTLYV